LLLLLSGIWGIVLGFGYYLDCFARALIVRNWIYRGDVLGKSAALVFIVLDRVDERKCAMKNRFDYNQQEFVPFVKVNNLVK